MINVRNLVADMFPPLFGALTGVLWVLPAVHSPAWQGLLIALPLIFGVTDLIENAMLFSLIESFPALPAGLVTITCLITQVKHSAYKITAVEFIVGLIFVAAVRLRRTSSFS